MWNIEEIKKDIRSSLSDYRYNHSLRVMEEAVSLAKHYHADIEKCRVCGLTHDMCKEYTKEENEKIIKEYNLPKELLNNENKNLAHGFIASVIVKEKYNFTNDMVLAIRYHSTGYPNMDTLAKIIYVADKIELNRKSDNFDIETERKLAKENLDKALLLILDNTTKYLIDNNRLLVKESIETRNKLLISNKWY